MGKQKVEQTARETNSHFFEVGLSARLTRMQTFTFAKPEISNNKELHMFLLGKIEEAREKGRGQAKYYEYL